MAPYPHKNCYVLENISPNLIFQRGGQENTNTGELTHV